MDKLIDLIPFLRWVLIGGFGLLVGVTAGLYLRNNWPDPDVATRTVFMVFLNLAGFCSLSLMVFSILNGWGPIDVNIVLETLMGYVIYGVAVALPILLTNSENL
jgi:hypothetical protein